MKEIQLTQGKIALVDDEDYERVKKHKWCLWKSGINHYAQGYINGKRTLLHRFILNATQGQECDHINHDGLNNQKSNLRFATASQNTANSRKIVRMNKVLCLSKFKGIVKNGRGWQSRITHNGKMTCLGTFKSEEEAARAYDTKAKELFGEFAYTNF